MIPPLRPVPSLVLRVLASNFVPFRNANGSICCSDKDALCDVCKSKHAARGHRSASTRVQDYEPPDAYASDAAKLQAADARNESANHTPIRDTTIHLDANGIPDPYAADIARLRAGYQR